MNIESILNGATSFANSFIPFLLTALAVVTGLYLVFSAVVSIYKKSSDVRDQESSYGAIALRLLIGGMLLRFGATVEDVSLLITGTQIEDYRGVLAYAPLPEGAGLWRQVMEVVLLWVVMLGWAGAYRGLLLWAKATNGGGSGGNGGDLFWQGIWHLIGGALAVNLSGAINSFVGGS